jgi:hypothetical protein
MADLKLNTANGSITLKPEDGSGNVDVTIPRNGVGKLLQMKTKLLTGTSYISVITATPQVIPDFFLDITPMSPTSFIRIDVRWGGEHTSAWDNGFGISRNGVQINQPDAYGASARMLGVGCITYYAADDNDSTPEFMSFSTIDSPASTDTLTYALTVFGAGSIYTGRMYSTISTINYERFSCEITLTEIEQ